MFSLLLESRERERQVQYEAVARVLHDRLMASLAADNSALEDVEGLVETLTEIIPCDGIGIFVQGRATLKGTTPSRDEFTGLIRFLNRVATDQIYVTDEIGQVHEAARDFTERAAGLLAVPLSRAPRDYIVFFRREVARSVTWAGNPQKPVTQGPNGVRLTPRKSFETWRELVRGRADPWSESELRVAESLRATLLEVVLLLSDNADRERRAAAERQELLIGELNHRVRNILGLVQGLVARSRGSALSTDDFADVLGGRVQALARAHDQITTEAWGPGSLGALIAAEAAAYSDGNSGRVRTSGVEMLLQPHAFSTLALVIHELITNSAKYGALKTAGGHVAVEWSLDAFGRLLIDWVEHGGPPVSAPKRRGFGTTIIERSIRHDLSGDSVIEFHLAGLRARLTIPAQFVTAGAPARVAAQPAATPVATARLTGRVLLVEDNIIIALDGEDMLKRLGAARVDIAGSVDEALQMIEAALPAFAVLDINLGNAMSFGVADRLRALAVPHCFATGYGDEADLPPANIGTPIVKKPYTAETLAIAVAAARGAG